MGREGKRNVKHYWRTEGAGCTSCSDSRLLTTTLGHTSCLEWRAWKGAAAALVWEEGTSHTDLPSLALPFQYRCTNLFVKCPNATALGNIMELEGRVMSGFLFFRLGIKTRVLLSHSDGHFKAILLRKTCHKPATAKALTEGIMVITLNTYLTFWNKQI